MTPYRKLMARRDDEIRRLDALGMSRPKMAASLNLSEPTLAYHVRRLGLQRETPKKSDRLWEITRDEAMRLRPAQIAERAGVTYGRAWQYRRILGCPPSRNPTHHSEAVKSAVLEKIERGMPVTVAARAHGVPRSTAQDWAQNRGLFHRYPQCSQALVSAN